MSPVTKILYDNDMLPDKVHRYLGTYSTGSDYSNVVMAVMVSKSKKKRAC